MKKTTWLIRILGIAACLAVFTVGILPGLTYDRAYPAFSVGESGRTPVIDAGHGGEDGGAVSNSGVIESGLNLEIAERLFDLMCFLGEKPLMTRTEDILSYDDDASTQRQKKKQDQNYRVRLVNSTENAVLISIHMNKYPKSSAVTGVQVFYSKHEGSHELALLTQQRLIEALNPAKQREAALISDDIYLTREAECPAIIVECGFISNPAELELLSNDAYQIKIAVAVAAAYTEMYNGDNGEGTA